MLKSKTIFSHSEKQTISLGKKIASRLLPGSLLGLVGELGSGKTQFVKGLAQGFGIKKPITSPTFVLLKTYQPTSPSCQLIHIDCYRLDKPEELSELGWNDIINNPNNIVVVEWADKIKSIMPQRTQWIYFKAGKKENQRIISFK
jgi:tRNA threonylcarbamoyladenosine biosynthesis protein TsaE